LHHDSNYATEFRHQWRLTDSWLVTAHGCISIVLLLSILLTRHYIIIKTKDSIIISTENELRRDDHHVQIIPFTDANGLNIFINVTINPLTHSTDLTRERETEFFPRTRVNTYDLEFLFHKRHFLRFFSKIC